MHLKNLTDDILGVLCIKANVSVKRLCINIDCENLCFIKKNNLNDFNVYIYTRLQDLQSYSAVKVLGTCVKML